MILCTDVDYQDDGTATAAGVLLRDWADARASEELVVYIDETEPYVPGQFYKRELPCIEATMSRTISPVTTIVVDGYTWLSPGRKGLGMHLWDSLGGTISVVGVAKTPFKDTAAIEVFRGTSKRPLFVTSQGIDPQEAARLVETMAGRHRFPDMLKRVDHLCRGHCQPDAEAW